METKKYLCLHDLPIFFVSGKAGYRFIGKACVEEKEILFSIEKIEALL